ncbi:hypothetical protein EDD92_0963 [Streptomyces sp. TLI_185]|nr:hypothetical protein EDD92_0963 [Streptomyces sp. TLI_185]
MGPSPDVVILTVLPVEFQAVSALLRERSTVVHPEGTRCIEIRAPGKVDNCQIGVAGYN